METYAGVCVVYCWFKQPYLALVRMMGLWILVRLHTCIIIILFI